MRKLRYGQHPNAFIFSDLLAYPKLLFKVGFFTLIVLIYTSYLFSRPRMFIETVSTITNIELASPGHKSNQYRFNVSYAYVFKNMKYEDTDTHFMPRGLYPYDGNPKDAAKAQEYVSNFKQSHVVGSDMKILVNIWQPKYSGFEVTPKSWLLGFMISFVIYYWLPLILTLLFISIFVNFFSCKIVIAHRFAALPSILFSLFDEYAKYLFNRDLSFQRRPESTSVDMDSRLRGNDEI